MTEIRTLLPKALWNHFADLNAIPRASKKEARVIEFMKTFGEKLNLETHVDDMGNVIIKKPASEGMEGRETVILQSHLDMVHQKNADVSFDFDIQGIEMFVEGDWVKAKGTTLGADNGIGVAMMMVLLSASDIPHPDLECIFTIDEETGMTGAEHLDTTHLSGKMLLNLDTEEDDEISIGCAGGVNTSIKGTYKEENTPVSTRAFQIALKGLKGGHSGAEIHLELGNANKLMNRLLYELSKAHDIRISQIHGGGLRNAIPRESFASFVVSTDEIEALKTSFHGFTNAIKKEYIKTAPNLNFEFTEVEAPQKIMTKNDQKAILSAVYACFNGVFKMSTAIKGLVETSSNLAKILLEKGRFEAYSLQRSSVESSKWDVAKTVAAPFHLLNFEVTHSGSYPGWQPETEAPLLKIVEEKYAELFHEKVNISAIHAGLECGLLKKHLPDTQMVSFGPTILGAHSPDERANIHSVQKIWRYLQEILKTIPKKN